MGAYALWVVVVVPNWSCDGCIAEFSVAVLTTTYWTRDDWTMLLHLGSGRNLFNVLVNVLVLDWASTLCVLRPLGLMSRALAWFNRGIDRLDIVTGI